MLAIFAFRFSDVNPGAMKLYKVGILFGEFPDEHDTAEITHDFLDDDVDAWVAAPGCPEIEMLGGKAFDSVDAAVQALVLSDVEIVCAAHDACYNRVKASYDVFPSARASQAIAKCRKKSGHVRHGKAGKNLKRWEREKWKDKITGKPCGHPGPGKEYCRPTKKVSKKTPKMYSGKKLQSKIQKKQAGQRAT